MQLTVPHLMVVVGIPGAGKSFFASKFAETFSAPYVDFADTLNISKNADLAREITDYTLRQLFVTKQTVLLEGIGESSKDREAINLYAAKNGYATLYIWVQTEPLTAEKRAVGKTKGKITQKEFDKKISLFTPPAEKERPVVISGKHTFATQAKTILRRLASERPRKIDTHSMVPPPRTKVDHSKFIR